MQTVVTFYISDNHGHILFMFRYVVYKVEISILSLNETLFCIGAYCRFLREESLTSLFCSFQCGCMIFIASTIDTLTKYR